jgi:hypothetical protein
MFDGTPVETKEFRRFYPMGIGEKRPIFGLGKAFPSFVRLPSTLFVRYLKMV